FVVAMTVATAGLVGFWSGSALLQRVASLIRDPSLDAALTETSQVLINLHRERRTHAESAIKECLARNALPKCSSEGFDVTVTPIDPPVDHDAGWSGETTFYARQADQWYALSFTWEEIKPEYDRLKDIITTRTHIDSLVPAITRSFSLVFAGALILAGLMGLVVTILL